MSMTTGIILALALGSVAILSTLFVVILFTMRNHWQDMADPRQPTQPEPPEKRDDQPRA